MTPANATAEPISQSFNVVIGLTWLLIYQLFGEVVVLLLALPIPGPVIGMLALFATLVIRGGLNTRRTRGVRAEQAGWTRAVAHTANGILRHLSLLFVPAGVGVMVHLHRLGDEWLPITIALVVSTLLALGVTGLLMQALAPNSSSPQTIALSDEDPADGS